MAIVNNTTTNADVNAGGKEHFYTVGGNVN
jgi:hypothetical protein